MNLEIHFCDLVKSLSLLPREELIHLIVEVESDVGQLDLLIPLYKHFKQLVEQESPEDL